MATTVIYLTSGTTWSVPLDWDNGANIIEVIGGGGAMSMGQPNVQVDGAGGGGAYSKIFNTTLTPGATVNINVGSGGTGAATINTNGTSGGDTWLASNNTATLITSPGVIVGAKGGAFGVRNNQTPAQGGQASAGVITGTGGIKFNGGNAGQSGVAGGGGAAGRFGPGGNGGGGGNGSGGAGGGGASGGSTGSAPSGVTGGSGGNSGAGGLGPAGGASTSNGTVGTNGTGGSGAGNSASPGSTHGGNGGPGIDWDASHGAGGGGGGSGGGSGSGSNNTSAAANGGLYGGGGGCAWAGTLAGGGNGAQGIIVITYGFGQPTPTPAVLNRIQYNISAWADDYFDDDKTAKTLTWWRSPQVTSWAVATLSVSKFVQYIVTGIPNNALMSGKIAQYIVLETIFPIRYLINQQQKSSWDDFEQETDYSKNILYRSKRLTMPELMQPFKNPIIRQQQTVWDAIEQEEYAVRSILTRNISAALPGVAIAVLGVQGSGLTNEVTPNPSGVPSGVQATGQIGSFSYAIDVAPVGVEGTGLTGAAIPVAVIDGVSASGEAQDLSVSILAVPAGVFGTGEAEDLSVEIDVAIIGVTGTGEAADIGPVAIVAGVEGSGETEALSVTVEAFSTGVSGTGHAQSLVGDIEIDVGITGVSGTADTSGLVPVAATTGVEGTGIADTFDHIEIEIVLHSAFGTGLSGAFTLASETNFTGVEGTGEVNDVIANVEPVILAVEGDGFTGEFSEEGTVGFSGVEGDGEVQPLTIEIDFAINGVEGTAHTDELIPAAAIDGVFGDGLPGIFEHLLETNILLGVSGTGRAGLAREVAVALGVEGIGLAQGVEHLLEISFEGVEGIGQTHTLFSRLFVADVLREIVSDDLGGMLVSQFVRESFLTEHLGNAAMNISGSIREVFTKNFESIINVGVVSREIVLTSKNVVETIKVAGMARETILKEFQRVRVGGIVRETLLTDGGRQLPSIVLVVT
jgi:hypothetical protein